MKKLLCLCLAVLLCMCGCGIRQGENTEPSSTEITQSPEEAAVFKVLMIGQSLAQDSVWLLCDVLRAERPDEEFLVADLYDSITLLDHRLNIL